MKRKKEDLNQLPLKINNISNSGEIVCYHWHSHIEIITLLSGEAFLTIGKNRYDIKAGDIYFINRTMLHSVFAKEKCHLLGFVIPISNDVTKIPIGLMYEPKIQNDSIMNLLLLLNSEYEKYKDISILKDYANLIIKLLIREIIPNENSETNSDVINFIYAHYFENISTEDIANSVNLSKYYFLHQFKKQYGVTVNSYLTNVRIEKAIEMLSKNKKTSIIAEKCGFSDDGYFCKVFKKVVGMSVRDYRKLYKS